MGALFFALFYWLIPAWLASYTVNIKSQAVRPAIEALVGHRIHWFKWLAVAVAVLFGYFSARNYFRAKPHTRLGEQNASFFARILARLLD